MRGIFSKSILAFILLVLLAFGARAYYLAALNRPSALSEAQTITINPGMGVNEIADLLFKENLIHSEALFKLYLKLCNLQATLEAGEYEVPPHLNLKDTVALFQHGTFDIKVTIPEGWRREEMAEYLGSGVDGLGFSGNGFLLASEGMEGYLFPETYFISREMSAEDFVARMREMFEKKFTKELKEEAKKRGLTEEEVVILASIVEREVKLAEDRAKVAGILIKRWKGDWPLEADATIQYAVATSRRLSSVDRGQFEWWPKKLTDADLEIDSHYNTRKYKGLPPAPICNPGLKALEAAVSYEESSYWFYVSDKEGKIHFSKTLDEHNQKVLEYK